MTRVSPAAPAFARPARPVRRLPPGCEARCASRARPSIGGSPPACFAQKRSAHLNRARGRSSRAPRRCSFWPEKSIDESLFLCRHRSTGLLEHFVEQILQIIALTLLFERFRHVRAHGRRSPPPDGPLSTAQYLFRETHGNLGGCHTNNHTSPSPRCAIGAPRLSSAQPSQDLRKPIGRSGFGVSRLPGS